MSVAVRFLSRILQSFAIFANVFPSISEPEANPEKTSSKLPAGAVDTAATTAFLGFFSSSTTVLPLGAYPKLVEGAIESTVVGPPDAWTPV